MELVKFTPEEQAKIDLDKSRPHAAVAVFAPLSLNDVFQEAAAILIELATIEIKDRAERAKMIVLSTSMSTNTLELNGQPYLSIVLLCQWAEIEKLEEAQRRQFLAGGGGPMRGGRGA
jgi:hypothetical protein